VSVAASDEGLLQLFCSGAVAVGARAGASPRRCPCQTRAAAGSYEDRQNGRRQSSCPQTPDRPEKAQTASVINVRFALTIARYADGRFVCIAASQTGQKTSVQNGVDKYGGFWPFCFALPYIND
jgi:hypothetical protein